MNHVLMNSPMTRLRPPFESSSSAITPLEVILPASIKSKSGLILPDRDLRRFLSRELCTPKIYRFHRLLWLAGLPIPARSLQRQQLMGRSLVLTDRSDEHLVWHQNRLFVKPLPDFLLSHGFWEQHLCQDTDLYRGACGILLSYAWLVVYNADFEIAKQHFLVPSSLTFKDWTRLLKDFLQHIDLETYDQVNVRYHYGELRQQRLAWLRRWTALKHWTLRDYAYGHLSVETWLHAFFQKNLGC